MADTDPSRTLAILEKIIASDDSIREVVEKAKKSAESGKDEKTRERRAARYIISHYANRCAVCGGLSGLPGLIPVIGYIYSIFGASATDAVAALKFEIEMALALSELVGYDISDPENRRFAIVLACAALEDKIDGDSSLLDIVEAAVSEYSTRSLSKTMIRVVTNAIVKVAARKLCPKRFIPFVGMAVGCSVSFVMSSHTGKECYYTLRRRKKRQAEHYSAFTPDPNA